jgi:hypothetical protein
VSAFASTASIDAQTPPTAIFGWLFQINNSDVLQFNNVRKIHTSTFRLRLGQTSILQPVARLAQETERYCYQLLLPAITAFWGKFCFGSFALAGDRGEA